MKTIIFIIVLLVSLNYIHSQVIKEVLDFDIFGGIRGMTIKNKTVVVVGGIGIREGDKLYTSILVSLNKDGKWTKLPNLIERNGKTDSMNSNGVMESEVDPVITTFTILDCNGTVQKCNDPSLPPIPNPVCTGNCD